MPYEEREDLLYINEKVVRKLGIKVGFTHAEFIIDKNGPKLIEIASRAGGGYLIDAIYNSTGINLYNEYYKILLEEKIDNLIRKKNHGSSVRFICCENGLLKDVIIPEITNQNYKIKDFLIYVPPNFIVNKPRSNSDRIGYFVLEAPTSELANKKANKLIDELNIEYF